MNKKLAILFLLVGTISFLNSQTYVSPGEGTLSEALANAQDGDVLLLVPDGEYTETASSKLGTIVNKSLTIAVDGEGRATVRMLKDDLTDDSTGVFFRMGNQSSLILRDLELDGNSKIKYLMAYYMPESSTSTLIKKVNLDGCYVHDFKKEVLHGEGSSAQGYVVIDSTIIKNTVFRRTGPVVLYKQAGSNYISLTNSTIATVKSYGLRACGCDATEGSGLAGNTPKVLIDHTTWYNIGVGGTADDMREIILGDKGPILRPWTVTNSIFVDQVSRLGSNRRTFINIKDNTTSGESCMGTITNICFWDIDKIAFYMHTVRDTIRMDPQFADTANYDFTLPAGSSLLTYGTDGKPIGDPRWGTNYVGVVKPQITNQPTKFALAPVYPNPFNPTTNLSFSLPVSGSTTLTVFDLRGNEVSRLVNEYLAAGDYSFTFDGGQFKSGVYLCRLTAAGNTSTRKMVLLK